MLKFIKTNKCSMISYGFEALAQREVNPQQRPCYDITSEITNYRFEQIDYSRRKPRSVRPCTCQYADAILVYAYTWALVKIVVTVRSCLAIVTREHGLGARLKFNGTRYLCWSTFMQVYGPFPSRAYCNIALLSNSSVSNV